MDKSILLIDDDRRALDGLAEALEERGYAPSLVQLNERPDVRFESLKPELVFVLLGSELAFEVTETIRESADGAIVPIIFVGTGTDSEKVTSPSTALSFGGDYFFSLPVEIGTVLAKVQTYVGPGFSHEHSPAPENQENVEHPSEDSWANPPVMHPAEDSLASASDALLEQINAQESKMQAELEARRQAESQRRLEEERERREEEERRRAEEEEQRRREEEIRRRREEEERRRAEEEEQRRREEEIRRRRKEEERRRAEEEEQRRREEEIRRQLEEEERLEREEEERRRAEEEERRIRQEAERQAREEERRRVRQEEERARREEEERRRKEASRIAKQRREELEEARLRSEKESQERAASSRNSVAELVDDRVFESAVPTRDLPGGLRPYEPEAGEFEKDFDVATLFHEIWQRQVTGQIEISSHHHQKALFFERGHPVNAVSSQIHDRMEEFLYRSGKITRAQYQEVRVKGLRAPRKIASYLATEGYLKPSELFEVVRDHLQAILFSIFEFEEGEYRYVAERVPEDDRVMLDLHPRALVVEGIRRKYTLPRLMERVGAPSSLLGPQAGDLDTLGLGPEDRQVVRLVDGTRNIEDIVFSTGLGAQRVYQVLAALLATGSAEVLVRGIEGVNPDGTSAADDIDRSRIREKYEHVRNADYFHILGVSRRATPYEVDRAFERNQNDYLFGRFSESIRSELEEELAEIEQVLLDARDILSDEALRDAYARNLP